MYHSLQQLELTNGLARERAQQARSTAASRPSRPRILRLITGRRQRVAPAPTRYA